MRQAREHSRAQSAIFGRYAPRSEPGPKNREFVVPIEADNTQ
jgi:hypothetical protein